MGELLPIYAPEPEDETIRDLIRARTDARQARSGRQLNFLKSFRSTRITP